MNIIIALLNYLLAESKKKVKILLDESCQFLTQKLAPPEQSPVTEKKKKEVVRLRL